MGDAAVDAVLRTLANNFARSLSVQTLAAGVGLKARTLSGRFKQEVGQSIHRYLTRLRLAESLPRIARGEKLDVVAVEVGYVSKASFFRQFRAEYGITPAEYRRRGLADAGLRNEHR
jgi:transcriptional regulator GlxA family with amidase domain